MTEITCCAGCGHSLVPMLTSKGSTEFTCLWCESIDARAMDMAKWTDSPTGKPQRSSAAHSPSRLPPN
ncbi:hypothetical protein ACU4GH_29665 [Bradyrhizobium betae]